LEKLDVDDRSQTTLTNAQKEELRDHHLAAIKNVLQAYDCLPANPRKIKALSNRLALQLGKSCINPPNAPLTTQGTPETPDRRYMLLVAMAIIHNFHRQLNEQLEKDPAYINFVFDFVRTPPTYPYTKEMPLDNKYQPMCDIIPSYNDQIKLPTNPSDSNVFRLHELFLALGSVTIDELTPFLASHS
jgi:hypothetical protein